MKLFRYICGFEERYGAAIAAEDAFERRTDVDPNYHFLPVKIEEVTLEGYEINVVPITDRNESVNPAEQTIENWTVEEMREWLNAHEVKYDPRLGEKKLRELVITTMNNEV